MKKLSLQELCLTGVMTAVVFLATFIPRIPIPLGYAHLGDAAIFLMVIFLPRRSALFAACVGSALADFLGGFPLWIIPTLAIKFIMADILWHFQSRHLLRPDRLNLACGMLLASLWMAFAYAAFGAFLYDSVAAGLASAPGLLLKGLVNTGAALLLAPALKRVNAVISTR